MLNIILSRIQTTFTNNFTFFSFVKFWFIYLFICFPWLVIYFTLFVTLFFCFTFWIVLIPFYFVILYLFFFLGRGGKGNQKKNQKLMETLYFKNHSFVGFNSTKSKIPIYAKYLRVVFLIFTCSLCYIFSIF